MTDENWRFIDSGPGAGADNMAVDEAMLEALIAGEAPPAIRVYTWRPAAVSLGRFQRADTSVDAEACRRLGIDLVRRPTGGRAILHTLEEVTFSVVVPAERLGTTGVMDSYRALARGIVAALHLLGLEARLAGRAGTPAPPGRALDPACFAVRARCDLVVGSAKLVGCAQVQRGGCILQQNSLPLRIRVDDWQGLFVRADAVPEATGLWEAADREIPYAEVAGALKSGFQAALGIALDEGRLSAGEVARAGELVSTVAVLDRETARGIAPER